MAMLSWPRSRLVRRILGFLLALGGIGLVYHFVRWRVLLHNGHIIAAQSAHFPRDYFVGEQGKPVLTYLVMGDSTAAGWGGGSVEGTYPYMVATAVAKRGYRVHVRNVAVGGANIWDVSRVQLPALQSIRPDLVTLTVGANDATQGTDEGDCIRGFRHIFKALDTSSARIIVVGNVPDMGEVPALPFPVGHVMRQRSERINVLEGSEFHSPRLCILPLYESGRLVYRNNPHLYASDLFHPSALGYRVWARLFVRSIFELQGNGTG